MNKKENGFLKVLRYFILTCIISIGLISIVATGGGGEEDAEITLLDLENRIYNLVNQHRTQIGLEELKWRKIIAVQCRTHSQDMAEGRTDYGHGGFPERVGNIRKEITFASASELVAYNTGYADPAEAVVIGWLGSTWHREQIEGDYDLIGVGVFKNAQGIYYFTQILIRL